MSRQRSILLALASRLDSSSREKPLSSREIHGLISSTDFDAISETNEIPDTPITQAIGMERLRYLINTEAQTSLAVESLAHKGVWCSTIFDEISESRMQASLSTLCPPILFGIGDRSLLVEPGYGVVGSRSLDKNGELVARQAGELCASLSHVLISGGARGADLLSMKGAIDNGGRSLGFLASGLTQAFADPQSMALIHEGQLTLVTPHSPDAPFSVGKAMGRNKLIYGASKAVLVVAADSNKGGTWAGATEALKHGFSQVNIWSGDGAGSGNAGLISAGGASISASSEVFSELNSSTAKTPSIEIEQIALF
jgi:predicted Rossmann fold nucleotide-binding protein DprA/Smf involved in DNA uptake